MNEVQVKGYIDKDVAYAFKAAVFRKHGKLYGVLSKELERAMKDYLSTHSNMHEHTTSKRVTDKKEEIKKEILKDYTNEISERAVKQYIAKVAGSDNRTVNKYFEILRNNTFLEHDRFDIYKIVNNEK